MQNKKARFAVLAVAIFAAAAIIICCFFLFTATGSSFIAKLAFAGYFRPQQISIEKTQGNLSQRLTLENVEIKDVRGFPQGSLLKIQKLQMYFTSFSPAGVNLTIENGRVKMPESEPILFYGTCQDSSLNLRIYSKQVNVREIVGLVADTAALKNISGRINDLDVNVQGPLAAPELTGSFKIERFARQGFSVNNCRGRFALTLKDFRDEPKVFGEVTFKGARVSGPKTAAVELKEGKVVFSGNPKAPSLNMEGTSVVEATEIQIILRGTMNNPDLQLSSQPAFSQQRLLLMLASGRGWKDAETALTQGQISADLVKDFIDYFVFSGSGSRIIEKFGISGFSVKYDSQSRGIAVNTNIGESLDASYGVKVEQPQSESEAATTTHSLSSEYKISESISIGAEKELEQNKTAAQDKAQTKEKILLKYKKEF